VVDHFAGQLVSRLATDIFVMALAATVRAHNTPSLLGSAHFTRRLFCEVIPGATVAFPVFGISCCCCCCYCLAGSFLGVNFLVDKKTFFLVVNHANFMARRCLRIRITHIRTNQGLLVRK
jgi:hypothetical protein